MDNCPPDTSGWDAIAAGKLCAFDESKTYLCGQYATWNGKLAKSKVNQSPDAAAEADQTVNWYDLKSPDSEMQWELLDVFPALFDSMFKDTTHAPLEYLFYPECVSNPLCSCVVPAGTCMLDLVPVLDDEGNPVIDDCTGEPKTEVRLFIALGDDGDGTGTNTTSPYEGSQTDPKTWDGGDAAIEGFDGRGYTACNILKRPVLENLNGSPFGPTGGELPCFIGCDELDPRDFAVVEVNGKKMVRSVDWHVTTPESTPVVACATPFQYARVDAFLPIDPISQNAPVQVSETGVTFYDETVNVPASAIQAGGVPACADLVEVVAITNVTHDASAPGASGHINIDSRVIIDGFSSRSYNNEAAGNVDDDHDYERNTGFARLNSDGSLDVAIRFRGNHPDGNGYATAVAAVKILGWGVQSVLT